MKDIQQLIKKNSQEGRYEDIFPKTFVDAVLDRESGVTLTDILAMFNMLFLSYNGSRSQTRLQVPSSLRREGLWVTYVLYDKTVVTEWYGAEAIDDTTFGDSANWRDGSNALVGDISISSDGYWVINGEVTNIKAQGEAGITPILRVGSNNHLQVSYTNGSTYVDVSPNPVFTQFRVSNNKLEQSVDLGLTWTVASDYIAAWFRFTGTTGSSQADNVGKMQISRDNGATWSDLSGEFTNSLHIKGYVATVGALPSTAVQGDIYGVGPTYDTSDTEHTNPIYQLYVKDSTGWVNNGRFTSIAAGVVQTTGTSTTEVMSQDAVSKEFASVRSDLIGKKEIMGSLLDADLSLNPLYADFYENSVILGSPYYDRLTLIASKTLLKGHRYSIIVKLENIENVQDGSLDVRIFSTNDLTGFVFVDENISEVFRNHKQEMAFKGYKFDYTPSADVNYLGIFASTATDGLQFSTFIYEEKADESVKFVGQELTLTQKKQARTNIGVEDDLYISNHILGSPFYQSQELIVEYPFKKGHTYIIHISTNANITNGIYSLESKDPFVIAEENLFTIGNSPNDMVYAFKPFKDAIGLGTWIQNLNGKYVNVTIYDKKPEEVTYVIVDADICGDVDDLFAMRVLAQAEKQGKIVFVGINVSQPAPETATGLDGFFCHEGISNMCIGLESTATVASTSRFLNACQKHYHTYTGNSDLEDSLDWYERALNFIPDNSKAILLTLGYYTSIVRLFADAALKSLFQRKINHVYCMGGNFVNSSYREYNFQYNVENTKTFIAQCPVPIYFVGFETCGNVMGGKVLGERGYTFDLMQIALQGFYREWGYTVETPMERNAPDAVAAMIACVDDKEFYNLVYVRGVAHIRDNGSVNFVQSATNGKHFVIWVNNTTDYPYEQWVKSMEMKLSHIMARDNEGLHSNVVRLPRV